MPEPIIPATPGQTAYSISVTPEDDDARPSADDVYADCYAVVAWRIWDEGERLWAEPILLNAPASNERVFCVMPDGKLCGVLSGAIVDDLAAARAMVLRGAQRAWDRSHAADNQPTKDSIHA